MLEPTGSVALVEKAQQLNRRIIDLVEAMEQFTGMGRPDNGPEEARQLPPLGEIERTLDWCLGNVDYAHNLLANNIITPVIGGPSHPDAPTLAKMEGCIRKR